MPYAIAQEYANIYNTQNLLDAAQQQGARDAIVSLGPFADLDDEAPTRQEGKPDPSARRSTSFRVNFYSSIHFWARWTANTRSSSLLTPIEHHS